ncbi:MAG: tail fiber domain-containing protein, partial [Alphaproteobacteria bacterium]|nr:tail fiber domain-containing protein [Alphaproteobacteria bacterium]
AAMGGYYSGLGIGGATIGSGNPIFGVLASTQTANGIGLTAFTVYDTNKITTYHNVLDNGSGLVGIGTTTPVNKLDVYGGVAIGSASGYAGSTVAPTNGMIVAGSVGIGTTAPIAPLQVVGNIVIPNNVSYQGKDTSGNAKSVIDLGVDNFVHVGDGSRAIYLDTGSSFNTIIQNGSVGIGSTTPVVSLDLSQKTDALALPNGASSSRPTGTALANGEIRYNSGTSAVEYWNGTTWVSLENSGSGSGIYLGASASATNPQNSSNAGTGLYSASTTEVDVAENGTQVAAFNASGINIGTGALLIGGQTGVAFPPDYTTDASIAIGSGALAYQTAIGTQVTGNIAVGYQALGSTALGTSARSDTAIGYQALAADTSGYQNTAVGHALYSNTTGNANVAMGDVALANNTTGGFNVAIGPGALQTFSPSNSVGVGYQSLHSVSGTANTAVGYKSGFALTSGANNTVLGANVGSATLTTGSNNILIGTGSSVDTPTSSTSNYLNIGNTIFGTNIGTVGAGNVGIGTTAPTQALEVNGNINVGSDSSNTATETATYGNYLYFLGASNNTDPLWIARYNASPDYTELRVNIGDNPGGPTDGDKFVVGATSSGTWYPRMTVTSWGDVGIGTTSPAATLEVNGNTQVDGYIYRVTANGNAAWMQQDGAGRQHWYWNSYGGTSPTFTVGGEDADDIEMHVNDSGTSTAGGYMTFRSANGYGHSAGDAITWTNVFTASLNGMYIGGGNMSTNKLDVNGNMAVGGYAGTVAPTNGFIVSGSVGIGTASPAAALDSVSTATAAIFENPLSNTGYNGGTAVWIRNSGTATADNYLRFTEAWNGTSGTDFGVLSYGANNSFTISNPSGHAVALQPSGGNVGIGSTTPVVSLDLSQKTDALALPNGASSSRPTGTALANGEIRYNSGTSAVEYWNGTTWVSLENSGASSGLYLGASASTPNPAASASDTTTGLYTSGTGHVDITSQGTQVADWSSTGLGIGTASALDALTVAKADSTAYVSISTTKAQPWTTGSGAVGQIYNTSATDSSASYLDLAATNAAGDKQRAYIGAVSTTGSGVYSPAMTFGIQTGSSAYNEYMRIGSNGYVGIGSSSPQAALDVAGGENLTGALTLNDTSSGQIVYNGNAAALQIYGGTGSGYAGAEANIQIVPTAQFSGYNTSSSSIDLFAYPNTTNDQYGFVEMSGGAPSTTVSGGEGMLVGTYGSYPLGFFTNNTQQMVIGTTGYVGIGTTVPQATFHVAAPSVDSLQWGAVLQNPDNVADANVGIGLQLKTSSYINAHESAKWAGIAAVDDVGTTFGDHLGLAFYTNDSETNIERVRITSSGNVGIGTTAPTMALQVNATAGGNWGVQIFDSSKSTAAGNSDWAGFYSLSSGAYNPISQPSDMGIIYGNAAMNAAGGFVIAPWASSASGMRITGAGNVGIGTASPSYTLQVNGTVAGAAAYTNLSDRRLKKDITPLAYGLDTVMQLRPVGFDWIKQTQEWQKRHQIGFIAQDVEKVVPEVVTTANDNMHTKSLAYAELVPVLTRAIQELHDWLEKLQHLFDVDHAEIQQLKSANENQAKQLQDQAKAIDELRHEFESYKKAHP